MIESKSNAAAQLIGRILIALLFLVSGIGKIFGAAATMAYMEQKGLPFPSLLLPLTVLLEVGGAVSLILGWRTRLAALALAVFTLLAALIFHDFWAAAPAMRAMQMAHFLKNFAIIGGLLLLATGGAGPVSLDCRRSR